MSGRRIFPALVAAVALSALVAAQTPVTKTQSVSSTATIQAIDSTARTITLRSEKGEEDTYTVGPEVKRFNELKVGDKVKATYWESVVMQVLPPLPPGAKPTVGSTTAAVTPGQGKSPAATAAVQLTTTVTVKAIDPKVPSITVTTEDGRTVTRMVNDPKNLEKVKVGDRIGITYTQAVLVTVEPAK
jgi:Cu/Ag efflux protein CusF